MKSRDAPLRHRVRKKPNNERRSVSMDFSFPGIVREELEPHEPKAMRFASYPSFQPKVQCYAMVASNPTECGNYILNTSAFQKKSKATLKRLAFNKRLSIRYAAEFEILRREIIDYYFPPQ